MVDWEAAGVAVAETEDPLISPMKLDKKVVQVSRSAFEAATRWKVRSPGLDR